MHKLVGAEIFKVGKHNNLEFTEADLDAIVQAFTSFKDETRIPLKFGHNNEQPFTDGQPALGWVDRVWRDGKTLFADFVGLPTVVFNAVKNGLYRNVSIELLKGIERDGTSFPWVLDAVALLGADTPAVRGLKDLQALTMSAKNLNGVKFKSAVVFTSSTNIGAKTSMTLEEMQAAFNDLQKKFDDQTKLLFTQNANFHRTRMKDILEAAVKSGEIDPRVRDRVVNSAQFKNDADVTTIWTETEIRAEIAANRRADFSEQGPKSKSGGNGEGDPLAGKSNAEVLTFKARENCIKMGQNPLSSDDLHAATVRVLREEPKLGRAYFDDPHGSYKNDAA